MTQLRKLRLGKELPLIELAYMTRIHPSQLSAIEHRKLAAGVRVRTILCEFFKVSESDVFEKGGLAV